MNPSGLDDLVASGGILASVGGVFAWGLRLIIRRTAKDYTEVRNDMSQSDYIKTLRDDADMLRKDIQVIACERNSAVAENGALKARLEMVTQVLSETRSELREADRRLDLAKELLGDLDPRAAELLRRGRDPVLAACIDLKVEEERRNREKS